MSSVSRSFGHFDVGGVGVDTVSSGDMLDNLKQSIDRAERYLFQDEAPLLYEFTRDTDLLAQYYAIREIYYRKDLNLPTFSGAEDYYDKVGHILVVRKGAVVVGGARLVAHPPNSNLQLPLEEPGFYVKEKFPELDLDHNGYSEISRFAISEEYRSFEACKTILSMLVKKSLTLGCCYHFSVSTLPTSRYWRILFNNLGIRYFDVRKDVAVPQKPIYGALKMVISVADFRRKFQEEGQVVDENLAS